MIPPPTPSLMPNGVTQSLARILRPQAAYRWLLPQVGAITPQYIETVLRGALAGNHVQQWELFDLMLDTWPELASCSQELTEGVMRKKPIFEPYAEEDEDPEEEAMERMRLVSAVLRNMSPDPAKDENNFAGTLKDVIDGWFRGVTALEVDWHVRPILGQQTVCPRATFWVHPVCFGWGNDGTLCLRDPASAQLVDFPPYKFLIGIHKAKSGSALGGALLRPLAWWWCAANFASDWLLNLAQVFGLPFRWANYSQGAPQATVDAICNMLQNMGSAGWAAFPAGTTLELKESTKTGDASPQGDLLDRADRYARMLILGQTMSGSQDSSKGGGKAFGEVEASVKDDRIDAAGAYGTGVINEQLIPAILILNYGNDDYRPRIRILEQEEGKLQDAQRDQVLISAGLEVGQDFIRKKYGIPAPAKEEPLMGAKAAGAGEEEPQKGAKGAKASEENDREDDLEEDIAAKLLRISAIEDDAVFARELHALSKEAHR